MTERPVGRTSDAGWQIGVARTIRVGIDTAWDYLMSPQGLSTWLGAGVEGPPVTGRRYETVDGTGGEFRSVRPRDRVRLTWQPAARPDDATVQIALKATKAGCTFRFHTERLYDSEEREAMRQHWRSIANDIEAELRDRK